MVMVINFNDIHVILIYLNAENILILTDDPLIEVVSSCQHEVKQRKKNTLFHWILDLIADIS